MSSLTQEEKARATARSCVQFSAPVWLLSVYTILSEIVGLGFVILLEFFCLKIKLLKQPIRSYIAIGPLKGVPLVYASDSSQISAPCNIFSVPRLEAAPCGSPHFAF